jgi:hypothetical protein
MTGVVPSHHSVWGGAAISCLSGGCEAPRVDMLDVVLTARVPNGPYLLWKGVPLPGCAYPGGRVVVPDGYGTTFNTRVPAVRCVWVLVVVSCSARHLMPPLLENPASLMLI